jgi:hypothetical protein
MHREGSRVLVLVLSENSAKRVPARIGHSKACRDGIEIAKSRRTGRPVAQIGSNRYSDLALGLAGVRRRNQPVGMLFVTALCPKSVRLALPLVEERTPRGRKPRGVLLYGADVGRVVVGGCGG